MVITPRRKLVLSDVSSSSEVSNNSCMMEMDFASGTCENLAPAGMDRRESFRHTPSKTPTRYRSASSPFASPIIPTQVQSPNRFSVSPLLGSSPTQGLKRHGFVVVRKRRSTFSDRVERRKSRTSSPLVKQAVQLQDISPKMLTDKDDYVLKEIPQKVRLIEDEDGDILSGISPLPDTSMMILSDDEDNLCSIRDDFHSKDNPFNDLIKRPLRVPGHDNRRPSLKRKEYFGDSPISVRTKRCLSLSTPRCERLNNEESRGGSPAGSGLTALSTGSRRRALRDRNWSVNDDNLPNLEQLKNFPSGPYCDAAKPMTGDFQRHLSLPVESDGCRHADLKYINHETLEKLLEDKRKNIDHHVIDCRYPYEFNGGHITGARNLFTKEQIEKFFFGNSTFCSIPKKNGNKNRVIVFHCEFSSERGPNMLKHLRRFDRNRNRYPKLDYPELYLLKGGYKEFYQSCPHRCDGEYTEMLDGNYQNELRQFRRKCRTLPAGKVS